ncbi:MAG: branched-chain amino acid ABC transporter permease [Candidatus Thiodiazotropha sp. (ex Lucina aurantia)]|nr:branched-chain amino acid ABC transporter permease [Candidatus Thiodiazotropha taylori]MBT3038127.1 branched-chain amino acid ABC transporter permease [Candidatus Thiodiazotropha sp. (ex Codakia orbicularis)]MBV2102279.1 branched-chain amino acid ABC transporter permease [Candidatus Thiodiazotropha sp. (ex Lucina aurantia)]MCG7861739.1 branched-chain amino acid ABC transporter permease [Candidatus Thiodiazotropha endolucinida]MBT3021962.1 branched-chain amino acid ABC transporter permease [C
MNTNNLSSFEVQRATRASMVGGVIALVALAVAISLPWWGGRADMRLVGEFCYYLALAQFWNLLAGYAGLVSVGQQAFVGLGGYALFLLAAKVGLHPLAAIPLAGVFAALFAIPTAYLVFRLKGAYFAIGTWVVAEVYRLGFAQVESLGGGSGMTLPISVVKEIANGRTAREMTVYFVALALAVAVTAFIYWLLRSRWGLALTAIRDSEPAAESLGVRNMATKYLIYLVAAFGTGVTGALIFLSKLRIAPEAAFSVQDWTANIIFIVVIGGIGRIEGPIIGTLLFFLLREFLSDFGTWYMIFLGAVAVVVMLKAPQGLWGLFAERFDIQLFPVQRKLIVKNEH